jgi:hypothetical protein
LNILPAISAPVAPGAQQTTFESDVVDTVRVEIPIGRSASTNVYHIAKSNDIRLLNTRKCAENRAAIYVLDSHAARHQLPNWFESGQTLDDIHDKARKFADEISAIHRERAGLQGASHRAAAAAAAAANPLLPLPVSYVCRDFALQRERLNMQRCSIFPKFAPSLFHQAHCLESPCDLLPLSFPLASASSLFMLQVFLPFRSQRRSVSAALRGGIHRQFLEAVSS